MAPAEILVSMLMVVFFAATSASPIPETLLPDKIAAFVNNGMQCNDLRAGLSIAVVNASSGWKHTAGFGLRRIDDSNTPVTGDTSFPIGQITKTFTAIEIMRVLEERKLRVSSARVRDLLALNPFIKYIDSNYLHRQYTLTEDCMVDKMGFPSSDFMRLNDDFTPETCTSYFKYMYPEGEYRASHYVNDLMYCIMAKIIEEHYSEDYQTKIREDILAGFEMSSTGFGAAESDRASGYVNVSGILKEINYDAHGSWDGKCHGAGGIWSTATDMAKWMLANLREGKDEDKNIIFPKSYFTESHEPKNALKEDRLRKYFSRPVNTITISRETAGQGWVQGHYRGFQMLQSEGNAFGVTSLMTLIPSQNIGVYTAFSGADPESVFSDLVHAHTLDLMLGLKPAVCHTKVCSFPQSLGFPAPSTGSGYLLPDEVVHTGTISENFEGSYENAEYGIVEVARSASDLNRLRATIGIAEFLLYPLSQNYEFLAMATGTFAHAFNIPMMNFTLDTCGDAVKLEIPSFTYSSPFIKQSE